MRIGVVFPQTEIGADPGAIRAYGQGVAELGFSHLLAYDHVLGADPQVHRPWTGPYDVHTTFHEPSVRGLCHSWIVSCLVIGSRTSPVWSSELRRTHGTRNEGTHQVPESRSPRSPHA